MDPATEDLLAALREKFLDGLPERFQQIERYVLALEEREDAEAASEIYRRVHSLKGSAGTYGAMILSNIRHQLEDFLTSLDASKLDRAQVDLALGYVGLLRGALERVRADEDLAPIEQELDDLRRQAFAAPLRALVLLPSRSVRRIVLAALGGLPLQVVTVDDGLTALQRLLHERFDLLVTGLSVPELPGPALIGAVRLTGHLNQALRVVVVTSDAAEPELPEIAQPDLVVTVGPQLGSLGGRVAALLDEPTT